MNFELVIEDGAAGADEAAVGPADVVDYPFL